MPARNQYDDIIKPKRLDIAIVGIGALFPGSDSVIDFWRDIVSGRDLITEVPPTHWIIEDYYDSDPSAPDKTYCKRGAFLSPTEFDPLEFRIPPANLASTDTSQLLGLKVAKQVLDDVVQMRLGKMDRDRISVILGVASGLELLGEMNSRLQRPAWAKALKESGIAEDQITEICDRIASQYTSWRESTFPGLLGNVVAGRIANHFDLGGTNCTVDAACASSFSAMSMAVNELSLGLSDLVITGGVDTTNGPFLHTCFSKTPALSPTGDCRPFSDASDGMVIGEGIGMVALKRLEDAQRDGHRIYAVVRGIGTSSDGAGQSVFAPLQQGQEKALRRCYEMAGYSPETVALVEAHGTGTVTGDRVEFAALNRVFREGAGDKRQWCALGSIKSQIGHTKSAAGVAGLIKAVLAIHNRVLPPTIKVDHPDSRLDLANSPFYLNTRSLPWITDGTHPRRASVSAFGFGGTNFHVTLEAYEGASRHAWKQRVLSSELILLDAKDREALLARCREITDQAPTAGMLSFLAQESQKSFDPTSAAKIAIVPSDEEDLVLRVMQTAASITSRSGQGQSAPAGMYVCLTETQPGALAFLFPGQDSIYLGMGSDLAMHADTTEEIWKMAAAIPMSGQTRLHEVVFPPPVFTKDERKAQRRKLSLPSWAQPATCTTSLSILILLQRLGITPDCVCGQGAGEMTALYAAGMLDAPDLIELARKRGECSEAPPPMTQSKIISIAQGDANTSATILKYLNKAPLRAPDRPIYANADGTPYPQDVDQIRQIVVNQMDHPVGFRKKIEAMYANGVRTFVEVGPGSELTRRVGRCLGNRPHLAVNTDRQGDNGVTSLWDALGRLAIHGVAMDFSSMWEGYTPVLDPRLKPKSKYSVSLLGCNYARPYPPPQSGEPSPAPSNSDAPNAIDENTQVVHQLPPSVRPKMEKNAMTLKNKSESDHPREPTVAMQDSITPAPLTDDVPLPDGRPAEDRTARPKTNGDMTAWIKAFQELQRQTAEAHEAFQKSMTDSHMAYLKAAEISTRTLGGMLSGHASDAQQIQPSEQIQTFPPPFDPQSEPLPEPTMEVLSQETGLEETVMPAPMAEESPFRGAHADDPAVPQRPAQPIAIPDEPPPSEPEGSDLNKLLYEVVAQKTGYPAEILRLEMNLEADLGIDSIKRVEILSTINERVPQMPEVDTAQLADLQTMGDVLTYMKQVADDPTDESPEDILPQAKPDGASPKETARPEPSRYALRTVPAPHHGISAVQQLQTGLCAVTDDGNGVGHALVKHLKDKGIDAQVVTDVPETAGSVIFLGGLRMCPDPEAAMAVNREAFLTAKKVSRRFAARSGFFSTVQDTGGNFGLTGCEKDRAWLAGLPGLIKTAAIEWPHATVKAVDLERSDQSAEELARAIGRELLEGGPEIEVGLNADGTRIRLESYPSALEHRYPRVDEHSVIVVSGGAQGVTAASLIQLAHRFHPKLVLLGRTVLNDEPDYCRQAVTEKELKQVFVNAAKSKGLTATPAQIEHSTRQVLANREIQSTLQALQAAGSEAFYIAADIRDASAVHSALSSVRRQWGTITGIIHGAGIIDDKTITEKTLATFDSVFNTKVQGMRSLMAATVGDPLEMICLFSSAAARLGNMGQCDYAMANEVLNKVAQAQACRRGNACVVKSINWGPWEGGMVSGALKAHFEQSGIPLIPLDVGARLFVEEIQAAPSDTVEVTIVQELEKIDAQAPGSIANEI